MEQCYITCQYKKNCKCVSTEATWVQECTMRFSNCEVVTMLLYYWTFWNSSAISKWYTENWKILKQNLYICKIWTWSWWIITFSSSRYCFYKLFKKITVHFKNLGKDQQIITIIDFPLCHKNYNPNLISCFNNK